MNPRKILVMKLRSLGDTVLMTAPLDELRRAYPEAEIHVVVLKAWAPIFEHNPDIAKVWTFERRKETAARAKSAASLALKLRREHFDTAVVFHASPTSATVAFASGAKTRSIHFHGHKDKNRHSTVTVPGKGVLKPIIERDMDTLRALGLHVPAGRLPVIRLLDTEKAGADQFLSRLRLKGPLLMIGLGASRPSKSWPIERYAALAKRWAEETGGSAYAIAGPDEETLIQQFLHAVAEARPASDVRARITGTHRLPVRQMAAILSRAQVYVGNDSGPKHVAVAVGTPTVSIFGPEHPFEWHPYPADRHPLLFVEDLPCRKDAMVGMPPWCGRHECSPASEEQHRCMREIGIDAVLKECLRLI